MCGIVGIYAKQGIVDEQAVRAMNSLLFHRGPIDEGFLFEPKVGLGMRRLSIIDIEGGHQPIYNEDRSIAVILNGEIYNYRELREDLLAQGHKFSTVSDTEVIVHLYEEMGEKCLDLFNGMFAFALWDARRQRLFLARDRVGVKPLYYYENSTHLAFSSELKALFQCPFIPREPDRDVVAEYLTLMYIRGPRSPFKGIRKLLPGHYLVADANGVHVKRYWNLRDHCASHSLNESEAIEHIRWLLEDSVRLRLRSDVPVGAFLSGGLDSSAVVAYAAAQLPRPLETFAVGFGEGSFDELGYARRVAEAFGTNHHEMVVAVDDAIQHLPMLIWHLDEPNADSAIVPTYLVSKFAASRLRVILSGLGGDELFGGYQRYFDGHPVEHLYRRIPQRLRKHVIAPLARGFPSRIANRVALNALSEEERYLAQLSFTWLSERRELLGSPANGDVHLEAEFADYPYEDPVNRRMFVDTHTYLPDDILHLTDRMSMAVSLEARTPFLDYRLVEFCAGLPGHYKVLPGRQTWKMILKSAMAPVLPSEILTRAKWGFGAPVLTWMNKGLLQIIKDLYRNSEAVRFGLLDEAGVRRQIANLEHVKRPRAAQKLWALLVLEVWCRVYLGQNVKACPTFTLDDLRQ